MKKILAILFSVFAFLVLAAGGAAFVMPDDDLAALLRPLPVVGNRAEQIVDYKADLSSSASHFIDDTLYSISSTWRDITDFSLTDRTQRVVIELEPVRAKKPRLQRPPAPPAVTPSTPQPPMPPASDPETPLASPEQPQMPPSQPTAPAMPDADDKAVAGEDASLSPEPAAPADIAMSTAAGDEAPDQSPAQSAPAEMATAPKPAPETAPAPAATEPAVAVSTPAAPTEQQEVAALPPVPAAAAKPKPVRKPPPPTPSADNGADEHKKGLTYYKGIGGVAKNFKTAANWFRQSSEKGNAASQYNLGIMAYLGQGVEQDYKEAARWFQMAANQDHALAQYNLGFLFYEGKGVEKDDLQAFMWIDRAARLGDEKAIKARDTLEQILPKDILKGR